ncbi:MAG: DUF2723 domain-containing protein [Candidatus Tritonobacter lacicola]|nr:DUF2723 domain-containing protein [Candidatus Tritonobacter lacicola]
MKRYKAIPVFVFLIAFGTYLFTLTPTVDFIDSGELAAVAHTLGIAHPTGYPLFTLLGHIVSRLPITPSVIGRLNIMSAFFAALAAGLFVLFIKTFLGILSREGISHREAEVPEDINGSGEKFAWLAAGTGGLILAWSAVFWETGTTLEVYSLHACFTVLLFLLAVRYAADKGGKKESLSGLLFFLVLGLSFANHLTTGALLPAFALLFLCKYIKQKTPIGKIILVMLPLLIGFSFYMYLPIRAAARPAVMWGEPTSIKALWDNLTVTDFRHRLFTHQSEGETLAAFFARVPRRIGYVPVPFMLWGIFSLYRRSKKYFYFVLAAFIPTILYAATYNVGDNIFYYNPGYICLAVYASLGLCRFFDFIMRKRRALLHVLVLVPLLTLPALFINYRAVDKKHNYFVEDYVRNLFSTIEPNAILFALDCQILIHPIYYYQNVEGFRTDVIVLPNHGLRKGWFAKQLQYSHPEIYEKSAPSIENYLLYLGKIESGEAKDHGLLDRKYFQMLSSIVSHNFDGRPIYITSEFDPNHNPLFHPGLMRIPEGLAWRLYGPNKRPGELPYRELSYRELTYPHKDADAIRHAYMYMLKERAKYESSRGNHDLALKWIDQGLRVYPEENLLSEHSNGTWIVPNRYRDLLETKQRIEEQ